MSFLELLKKFWFIPVLVIIVFYFQIKEHTNNKIIEEMRENYSSLSIEQEKLHKQELKQRDEALQVYQNKLAEAEKKYNESIFQLEKERKNKIKVIANEIKEPLKLSNRIKQTYGFSEFKK